MRILLVSPIKETHGGLGEAPPLGLGYLATALKREGQDVAILDCVNKRCTFEMFENYISRNNFELIGITVYSAALKQVKRSLEIIKKVKPKTITVVGGPHPSAAPEHTLSFLTEADFAFRGEGEISFPLFIKYLKNGQKDRFKEVPGLVWREAGKIMFNEIVIHQNIDDFDFPAWDLIRPKEYGKPGSIVPKGWASIITSRGCPYQCTFCSAHIIAGCRMRYRSIDRVIQEIKYLYSRYGIRKFSILDENFTLNRLRAKEFCQKILNEDVKFEFMLPNGVRLDTLTEDLLELMKRVGFSKRMAVGIESGSERILKMIKKNLSKEKIREKIELMDRMGFQPIGYFILGFPTETREEMQETIDFAMALKLYRAAFTPLIPLPGTEIFDTLVKNHELPADFDFSRLSTDEVNYAPKDISREELDKTRRRAILKFHLRPRVVLNFMQDYSSFIFAAKKFANLFLKSASSHV
jgi:radical SAM superfamily enzyme YgiQ (UPF0313 family)